jgi:hypothetical protein
MQWNPCQQNINSEQSPSGAKGKTRKTNPFDFGLEFSRIALAKKKIISKDNYL